MVRTPPCHGGGRGFESHPGRHKCTPFSSVHLFFADLAHPVERHLAKVEVASSSLVIRSTKTKSPDRYRGFLLSQNNATPVNSEKNSSEIKQPPPRYAPATGDFYAPCSAPTSKTPRKAQGFARCFFIAIKPYLSAASALAPISVRWCSFSKEMPLTAPYALSSASPSVSAAAVTPSTLPPAVRNTPFSSFVPAW